MQPLLQEREAALRGGQGGAGDAGVRARQPKQGEAAPAAALHPQRARPHSPENTEAQRVLEGTEGTNKRHDYTAVGFVCEVFIPEEGKEQSKGPKRLMVREAVPRSCQRRIALAAPLPCVSSQGTRAPGSARRLSAGRTTSRLPHNLSLQLEVGLGLLHSIHISHVSQTQDKELSLQQTLPKRWPKGKGHSGGKFSPSRSCRWCPVRRLSLDLHPTFLKTHQRPSVQDCSTATLCTPAQGQQQARSLREWDTGWDSISLPPDLIPYTPHSGLSQALLTPRRCLLSWNSP